MNKMLLVGFLTTLGIISNLQSSYAYSQNKQLVLGVSLSPDYPRFNFPCSFRHPAVFCGKDIASFKDAHCRTSLQYESKKENVVDIKCTLNSGQLVTLATASGELTVDPTQDAFGFVDIILTKDGINQITTPSRQR